MLPVFQLKGVLYYHIRLPKSCLSPTFKKLYLMFPHATLKIIFVFVLLLCFFFCYATYIVFLLWWLFIYVFSLDRTYFHGWDLSISLYPPKILSLGTQKVFVKLTSAVISDSTVPGLTVFLSSTVTVFKYFIFVL